MGRDTSSKGNTKEEKFESRVLSHSVCVDMGTGSEETGKKGG